MKDFCKWLGVSDKIAKLIVWLFIGMAMLIVFNTALESYGLPYYKITADNLLRINIGKVFDFIIATIVSLLNFYTVIFLVFRIKEFKKIFPYSIIYVILNILFCNLFNDSAINNILVQIYIPIFIILFCYFYSNKNWKYIIYSIISYAINFAVQYVCYLYKLRFIDYENITQINRFITSIDFLIIMLFLVLIKEIIRRRKEVKQ